MQHLIQQGIRCLILTSGTLAPLDALVSEFEFAIPIRLSNKHIINDSQVYVKIVGTGKDNKLLNSGYHNRYRVKIIFKEMVLISVDFFQE